MSGFSPDWLALREPADHAARDRGLLVAAAAAAGDRPLVVDLGCGTGSNRRALAPHLPGGARWRLIDHDAVLLEQARRDAPPGAEAICVDLAAVESLPLEGATLVTAAALFDLVSAAWFDRLAARLARLRLPLYAALSFDGHSAWAPPHPLDRCMADALNEHQRTDKGFGAALGPDATRHMAQRLGAVGFTVRTAASPWRLGPEAAALQAATSAGYAAAVLALGRATPEAAESWLRFRTAAAERGVMEVGHQDLLALPPD